MGLLWPIFWRSFFFGDIDISAFFVSWSTGCSYGIFTYFNIFQLLDFHSGLGVHQYGCVWKCVPLNPMVLLIIIPIKNCYFIGGIHHFQTNPYSTWISPGLDPSCMEPMFADVQKNNTDTMMFDLKKCAAYVAYNDCKSMGKKTQAISWSW